MSFVLGNINLVVVKYLSNAWCNSLRNLYSIPGRDHRILSSLLGYNTFPQTIPNIMQNKEIP